MRIVVVSYKVKPDRLDEHLRLLEAVFEDLGRSKPPGLRYGVARAADGLSFTHIAATEAAANPLGALPAFQAFTKNAADRCEAPPAAKELAVAFDYGLFAAAKA